MTQRRHKVVEREEFTNSQKEAIAAKSNHKCAWCGKKVYFKYGATIDHFVPIKKGGTNDFDNLVMMCKECNEKKGSMIIPLNIAGKYLSEEAREQADKYFEDYAQSYEFISRGNLLTCDMYEMFLIPEEIAAAEAAMRRRGKKSPKLALKTPRAYLIRAYPDDTDKLSDYFIKYLKKYDRLESEVWARENVKFWMKFGVIYYVEKDGNIQVMVAAMLHQKGCLITNLFPYYSTKIACTMARGSMTCLAKAILDEQSLPYIPVIGSMIKEDKSLSHILRSTEPWVLYDNSFYALFRMFNEDYHTISEEGNAKLDEFMKKFGDVSDKARLYLYENDLMDLDWMLEDINGLSFLHNLSD